MTERNRHPDRERTRHDATLLRRAAAGDERAREQLVERFMPLARKLARRYASSSETFEDVQQVASIGLIKAIDGFDLERGCSFSSYAVPTIVGELKRYFRDRTWTVRPPRDLLERALRIERASELLRARSKRSPTLAELAEHLGLTHEQTLDGLEAARAQHAASFDGILAGDDDARAGHDPFGAVDEGFAHAERRVLLGQLGRVLTEQEAKLLELRFGRDLTQSEIGDMLGVSQMQVSRLVRRALERLQTVADHDDRRMPPAA